ncbi:hypothetical protein ADK38_05070 [Streptomyces varsoviensis]|uniref:DUF5753 domain-containing protein n=3 Tax=Streptomyces varsoviensis TaxID=67373 RepID=A0ABR5JCB9_9ACTN|nr:hypothetical protein ADK38_05070 [Streptomyces varsoviensis]
MFILGMTSVGGPQVMAQQLEHLVQEPESPHITIHVFPRSRHSHHRDRVGATASDTYYRLRAHVSPDESIAYINRLHQGMFKERTYA